MRYVLDAEFIEYPGAIDLISIGVVAENGREFYAECSETDWSKADEWILRNVRPYLLGNPVPRAQIQRGIIQLVGDDPKPEFWAYYGDYDWVVFCQLFGRMIDLPRGWPKLCLDIKQQAIDLGSPQLPSQTETEHNGLYDARWGMMVLKYLDELGTH